MVPWTNLGEPVGTGGELLELDIEVFLIGILLLRLQVVVAIRAGCKPTHFNSHQNPPKNTLRAENEARNWNNMPCVNEMTCRCVMR